MAKNLRRMLSLACASALLGVMPLYAEDAPKKEDRKPRAERNGNANNNWMERIGRFRALDKHERDHESIRIAFRDVVNEPHKATVRVLCDDKAASLGAVVDADGYILTKASELKGKLGIKLHDNRLFDAILVGVDPKTDLAMLKIDATNLVAISWRDAADVPAVGSFLASAGLETIPVAIGVVSVQPRFIAGPHGILGIELEENNGVAKVAKVRDDSPAKRAGMKDGDQVLSVNGAAITGREQLVETIRKYQPDEKVTLEIQRGEEKLTIDATLGKMPASPDADRKDFQNTLGGPLSERRGGFASALQHDTVLTPQDCGGPLVDLDGRCVGLNIARAGRVNSYALPAAVIVPLLADFKAGKFAPGPTPDQIKLELVKKLDTLKQSETSLATKLAQLLERIGELRDKQDAADLLKQTEAEKAATESELGKIKLELEKIANQKTSLEK